MVASLVLFQRRAVSRMTRFMWGACTCARVFAIYRRGIGSHQPALRTGMHPRAAGVVVPLLLLFIYVGFALGAAGAGSRDGGRGAITGHHARAFWYWHGAGALHLQDRAHGGRARQTRLEVQVGDQVKAGQVLGEMEPVDLDDRVRSQDAAYKRSQAALTEAQARQAHAQTQARRYEQLLAVRSTSEEIVATKRQELQIADAALSAAREETPGPARARWRWWRSGAIYA